MEKYSGLQICIAGFVWQIFDHCSSFMDPQLTISQVIWLYFAKKSERVKEFHAQEDHTLDRLSFPVVYICLADSFTKARTGYLMSKQTFENDAPAFRYKIVDYHPDDVDQHDLTHKGKFIPTVSHGKCLKFQTDEKFKSQEYLGFELEVILVLSQFLEP